MINKYLSRYNFNYPRSLIYMLQASEYSISSYLVWYRNIKDFRNVENRKKLDKTPKAIFLLMICWAIVIIHLVLSLYLFEIYQPFIATFTLLIIFILTPYILIYEIIIPLLILKIFVQLPYEHVVINKAKKKLRLHKAIKIGIAGSYGKTTMREILKTVLLEGKKVSAPPHSFNTLLGISKFINSLDGSEEVLIFELGEYYPGDIRKLCNLVKPEIGIITGINEAHLEKFKSIESTIKTIFELADFLNGKLIYLNADNDYVSIKANTISNAITYNGKNVANWKIDNAATDLNGTSFTMTDGKNKLELKSDLLGLHQIGPIAVAVDMALRLGLSFDQVKNGVLKTKPFDHRLELKKDNSGVITLDDSYNGNPDGVKAVINFLSGLKNHRRFYVTPGLVELGDKTEIIHKQIGNYLAEAKIEKVILIRNSVTKYIEQGLLEKEYSGEIIWFDNALKAFSALPNLTINGDVVLLQNDWPDQYQYQ